MKEIRIKASVREGRGKSACKHLRDEGFIPGVVYKGGEEAMPVFVDKKEIWHALHTDAGENAIITLDFKDKGLSEKTVIVKETQADPVKDLLLHVDFQEISLTETVQVKVSVVVKGEAVGVKEDSGILNQALWELEVECMAKDIPEHFDVNVDELRIGDAIHVKDIAVPEGITLLDDPEQVVVGVTPPQAEEEIVTEPAEGAEVAEPEVIKKGKKEEEGEEGAEGKGEEAAGGEA